MSDFPSFSRRRLLTAMALSPLLYSLRSAAKVPDSNRIVALEWLPVELMMALGVTPFAVADVTNYRLWVNEPALPDGVIDVGLRTEPNLELLTQLHPSLILYSQGYGPAPEKINRIAPAMGFSFNDGSGKPLASGRQSLITLANALAIPQRATTHLAEFDAFIAQMKQRLAARLARPLLMITLMDARHALVFSTNSLFQDVLEKLGIENAWRGESNFWGSVTVGLERLADIHDADVICFDHGNEAMVQQVMTTPLWQALPFIRQQRFTRVPAVWYYGATLSAMRFCRVLDTVLGGKA